MDFGPGWRPPPAGGCWRRGEPRAASACRPEATITAAAPQPPAVSIGGRLGRLKLRADFLRVAAARSGVVQPGFVLQAAARPEPSDPSATVRVGFTASRKVGNAVIRNRAKRRLRAAAAALLPRLGKPGADYVLVARSGIVDRPYASLLADLEAGLRRIERKIVPGSADPGRGGQR